MLTLDDLARENEQLRSELSRLRAAVAWALAEIPMLAKAAPGLAEAAECPKLSNHKGV